MLIIDDFFAATHLVSEVIFSAEADCMISLTENKSSTHESVSGGLIGKVTKIMGSAVSGSVKAALSLANKAEGLS